MKKHASKIFKCLIPKFIDPVGFVSLLETNFLFVGIIETRLGVYTNDKEAQTQLLLDVAVSFGYRGLAVSL